MALTSTSTRPGYYSWKTEYDSLSPPASCATLRNHESLTALIWGRTCTSSAEPTPPAVEGMDNACYPWLADQTGIGGLVGFFFSPASACPQGWVPLTTVTATSDTYHALLPSETAIRCCPSGLEQPVADTDGLWSCVIANDATTTVPVEYCSNDAGPVISTAALTYPRSEERVWGYPLELRYQGPASSTQDSLQSSVTSASTGLQTTTGPTRSSTTILSSTGLADPGHRSAGLSTGAKAGIGVAIPIVVLLAIGILLLCFRRRRNRGKREILPNTEHGSYQKAELDAQGTAITNTTMYPGSGILELDAGKAWSSNPGTMAAYQPHVFSHEVEASGMPIRELSGGHEPRELDMSSSTKPEELDASATVPQVERMSSVDAHNVAEGSITANNGPERLPEQYGQDPRTLTTFVNDSSIQFVSSNAVTDQTTKGLSELKAKRERLVAEQEALVRLQHLKEEQRRVEEEIRRMEQNGK